MYASVWRKFYLSSPHRHPLFMAYDQWCRHCMLSSWYNVLKCCCNKLIWCLNDVSMHNSFEWTKISWPGDNMLRYTNLVYMLPIKSYRCLTPATHQTVISTKLHCRTLILENGASVISMKLNFIYDVQRMVLVVSCHRYCAIDYMYHVLQRSFYIGLPVVFGKYRE